MSAIVPKKAVRWQYEERGHTRTKDVAVMLGRRHEMLHVPPHLVEDDCHRNEDEKYDQDTDDDAGDGTSRHL